MINEFLDLINITELGDHRQEILFKNKLIGIDLKPEDIQKVKEDFDILQLCMDILYQEKVRLFDLTDETIIFTAERENQ